MIRLTSDKHKFTCPKCHSKVPWTELLQFKKDHITICAQCNTPLKPRKIMTFSWGFFLGFAGFIVPAKIVHYLNGDFLLAALAGGAGATLITFTMIVYLYNTVEFVELT